MNEREELLARADKFLDTSGLGSMEYASEILRDMAVFVRRTGDVAQTSGDDKERNDLAIKIDTWAPQSRPLTFIARERRLIVDALRFRPAQAVPDCGAGFLTVDEWPKEIDERVLLYVVHHNAQYEPDEAKRISDWEGWCVGSWTDFNGGGWTWHGMLGVVTHVAPLLPRPTSQLPSTGSGGAA